MEKREPRDPVIFRSIAEGGGFKPGFVQAPSGLTYALVFIGRSGEPFPAGIEIHAIVPALEPLDDVVVDQDLWAILGWVIEGVGAPWTVEGLHATGRLYRIPAAT